MQKEDNYVKNVMINFKKTLCITKGFKQQMEKTYDRKASNE